MIYYTKDDNCNRVMLKDKTLLNIDLDSGWHITSVEYSEYVDAESLDHIRVTFQKRTQKNELAEQITCMGCKHSGYVNGGRWFCLEHQSYVRADEFCSRAERRGE